MPPPTSIESTTTTTPSTPKKTGKEYRREAEAARFELQKERDRVSQLSAMITQRDAELGALLEHVVSIRMNN